MMLFAGAARRPAAVYRSDGHATLRWILGDAGEVVDTACFNASEDA